MLLLEFFKLVAPIVAFIFALPVSAANVVQSSETTANKAKEKKVIVVRAHDDDSPDVEVLTDDEDLGDLAHWTTAKRGFLGVRLLDVTPELREHFGAPKDAGVMIARVEADSPAAKAGVQVGDILATVDGDEVKTAWDIQRAIRDKKEGETVSLEVWRDRRKQSLSATITEKERTQFDLGDVLLGAPGLKILPHGEGAMKEYQLQLDAEKMERMAERLKEKFSSPEFQERIRRSQELEQRMQELEKKLQEMEKKLKERSASPAGANHT